MRRGALLREALGAPGPLTRLARLRVWGLARPRRPAGRVHRPEAVVVSHASATEPKVDRKSLRWISRYLPAVSALFLTVTTLHWFRPGTIMATGDFFPYYMLNPTRVAAQLPFVWNHVFKPGGEPNYYLTYWPLVAFSTVLHFLGSPPWLLQALFFVGLRVSAAAGMYLLLRRLLRGRSDLPVLVGTTFYLFNQYTLTIVPNQIALAALSIIPLLGWMYLSALQAEHPMRWVVPLALASSLTSFTMWNPPVFAVTVAGVALIALYGLVTVEDRARTFRLTAVTLLLSLPLNLWWIVPAVSALFASGAVEVTAQTDPGAWNWVYARSSLPNAVRLNTVWAWAYPEYFPYADRYNNPLLLLTTWVGPLLALTALFWGKLRRNGGVVLLASTSIVLIVLSKGTHAPLASLNQFLYAHVPGFWLFREPAAKFGILLCLTYAVLIAFSTERILERVQRRIHPVGARYTVSILIGVMLLSAYPLLTGDVIPDKRPLLPSSYVTLPDYWKSMASYVNSQDPSGRLLLLPNSGYYSAGYSWGYYGADDLALELVNRPVIRLDMGAYNYVEPIYSTSKLNGALYQSLKAGDASFVTILRYLGVRYILERNDVNVDVSAGVVLPPSSVRDLLSKQPGIQLVRRFGSLDLYRVEQTLPLLYPASRIALTTDTTSARLPDLLGDPNSPVDALLRTSDVPGATDPASLATEVRSVTRGEPWPAQNDHVTGKLDVPATGKYSLLYRPPATHAWKVWAKQSQGAVQVQLVSVVDRIILAGRALQVRGQSISLALPIPARSERDYAVEIGGARLKYRTPEQSGTPVLIGQVSLAPGPQTVAVYGIDESVTAPYLPNPSFEEGIWGEVVDANQRDSRSRQEVGISAALADEATQGRRSLLLTARDHAASVSQALKGFRPGARYLLSFDYRHISGAAPRAVVWQKGTGLGEPSITLPVNDDWQHYETVFTPAAGTTGLSVALYAWGTGESLTANLYDNVQLREYNLLAEAVVSSPQDAGWQSVGSEDLRAGELEVSVPAGTVQPPALADASFEDGTWGGVVDANKYDGLTPEEAGLRAARSPDASAGRYSLELSAAKHSAAVETPILYFDKNSEYKISFDYKHVSGSPPRFAVWQEGAMKALPGSVLPTRPGWSRYEALLQPDAKATGAAIFFYSDGGAPERTVNLYDNVTVQLVADPGTLLAERSIQPPSPRPTVSYVKLNPTSYRVDVEGAVAPWTLVFSENFHPGWEAQIVTPNKPPRPLLTHFPVNGYANAWRVPDPGSYSIIIRYAPQARATVAYIVSAVTALACLAYVALAYLHRRRLGAGG